MNSPVCARANVAGSLLECYDRGKNSVWAKFESGTFTRRKELCNRYHTGTSGYKTLGVWDAVEIVP